ncbi:MAG: ATP-grasp domain-containing protein, partial [Bacteroidota bacterium]
MNLHEYQGKELLKKFGVAIQEGIVAGNMKEAMEAYTALTAKTNSPFAIVKAQIHAGGRGKGGGVKLAKNAADFELHANNILGMYL